MKEKIIAYLDNAITLILLVVAGTTPLLFLNQTTEFYEIPKLAFLVIATILLYGVWIFSWIAKGKVVISRTPLDIPLLILLGAVIASAYFSLSKYIAIFGNFPTVHGSTVSWVTYILLYFVTVSNLKHLSHIKNFMYVLYGSAVIVAVISFLSFFTFFLPFDFTKAVNFTPTGSSFSTIAFLLLLLPLPLLSVIMPNKYIPLPIAILLSTLFGVVIVLIGSVPSYVALFIIFALCTFVSRSHKANSSRGLFFVPVAITVLTLVFAYLPLSGNFLQQKEANFPKEIQLPFSTSWKIAASVFRDAPFVGTGPSTFLFNFTTYKPAEYNLLNFWNFSFDTAYNEFLQNLGTLGILGFLALLFFCFVVFNVSIKNLTLNEQDVNRDEAHVLLSALAISGLVTIILLAIHSTTLISIVTTFFVLAVLIMSQKSVRNRVIEISMGLKVTTSGNRQFDLFPIIIFIIFLAVAIPVSYRVVNVIAADYYHHLALVQATKSGTVTYNDLQKAEALNPQVDLYRVDMAQTNFALANAIVAQKGPSKDNPNRTLSDQDKQTIQTLLSQAIAEGRTSVILSPLSGRDWEVLAALYKNISGVANNALAFSLDAYGRAIQIDPLNPALRLNIGGIYYSVKNYDMAVRYFTDAANLKPDYTNAYFNLSIALREKGDLQNAKLVAEQTVALLKKNPKSPDYKTANDLLADINTRISKSTPAQTQTTPTTQAPAAQTNSALDHANLPNVTVPNLNNPPQVVPAAQVKSNPNAKLPQPSLVLSPSTTPTKTP